MDFELDGKTMLVTGGTQGVGACIAKTAAQSGVSHVVISGRDEVRGRAVCRELKTCGCTAYFVKADLADAHGARMLFSAAMDKLGQIDLLVNAAGLTDRASVLDGDLDDWERLFAVNARAPFFLMQQFVRHRLDVSLSGSVVNIQSMNAHCGAPELAIYSASKGALVTLTKNVAHAHLADKIRVNGINMGWVATPAEIEMQAKILGKGAGWISDAEQAMPLGRLLLSEEVAKLCVYLLSDASGLQTGTNIDLEQRVVGAP